MRFHRMSGHSSWFKEVSAPKQLWDLVTREGRDGIFTITTMASDGLTCTLTLMHAGRFTNLEHYRVLVSTLTCVEKL